MSLPSSNATNGQSSIRNFFRPKQAPAYSAPPSSSSKPSTHQGPLPPTSRPPQATTAATTATATATATSIISTPPQPQNGMKLPPPSPSSSSSPLPPSSATPPRPTNLHPQASIQRIRPEHVQPLRRITSLLLPINYPDSFYARLADPLSSGAFSRVVIWHEDDTRRDPGKVVGGLVCRPEPSPFFDPSSSSLTTTATNRNRHFDPRAGPPQPNALYIQSLVLLSPYRSLGLAAALLDEVVRDAATSEMFACETVWAHVWTRNDDGLKWYLARGFAQHDEVMNYYVKLQPGSAWIVKRDILLPATAAAKEEHDSTNRVNTGDTYSNGTNGHHDNSTTVKASITAAVANLPPFNSQQTRHPPLPLSTTGASQPQSRPSLSPLPPRSSNSSTGQSFQNTRPETEWNDLPADMQPITPSGSSNNLSVPPRGSGTGSGASSRSSSATGGAARKKRDRAYPAAAFGS